MRHVALPDVELRFLEARRCTAEVFDREMFRHALESQHSVLAARMPEPEQVVAQGRG